MGSSEIVDSGRFSGGRSSFSQTCSLLSQYLKENGSFGDLTLGLSHNKLGAAPTETMNFLPMIEKSNPNTTPFGLPQPSAAAGRDETQKKSDLNGTKSEAETAPMTIFYAGKVIVFDDLPADKAKEIMMLASKSSAAGNHPNAAFAPPRTASIPTFGIQEPPRHSLQPPLDSDLPIARKNSLARFLEKRRDRITENAPYSRSRSAAVPPSSRPANPEEWLGLARQLPVQVQRH